MAFVRNNVEASQRIANVLSRLTNVENMPPDSPTILNLIAVKHYLDTFPQKLDEFVESQDHRKKDDWYTTERVLAAHVIKNLKTHLGLRPDVEAQVKALEAEIRRLRNLP